MREPPNVPVPPGITLAREGNDSGHTGDAHRGQDKAHFFSCKNDHEFALFAVRSTVCAGAVLCPKR